jgi:putative sigma-54 modulation protein
MNTSIVGRHIELTEAIKTYIDASVKTFEKFNLDIISVHSIVDQAEKHGKHTFTFEFTINIANLNTIVIKQKDKDLYSAIDIAVDRASKKLRRHHDKISSHKAVKLSEAGELIEDVVANELSNFEDEIVPVKLQSYKPMDIADALEELKNSDDIFKVFYDKDDNLRVLYKMKDAKYGIY